MLGDASRGVCMCVRVSLYAHVSVNAYVHNVYAYMVGVRSKRTGVRVKCYAYYVNHRWCAAPARLHFMYGATRVH